MSPESSGFPDGKDKQREHIIVVFVDVMLKQKIYGQYSKKQQKKDPVFPDAAEGEISQDSDQDHGEQDPAVEQKLYIGDVQKRVVFKRRSCTASETALPDMRA